MQLSILIPSFNRRARLADALDSIMLQSYFAQYAWAINQAYEIIVIDDGSTDGTAVMLRESYPAVQLHQQANLGVSAARNAGLQRAQGEWIALLDSDDTWLPGKLSAQFEAIEQSQAQICHTEEVWVRNGVRVKLPTTHLKHGGMLYPHCLMQCAMSPSSILLHREVLARVGNFDEALPVCEDYDLWLRVCAAFPVALVSTPQILKTGGHTDQLSRQFWGMDRFRVIALEKILYRAQHEPALVSLLTQELIDLTRDTLLAKLDILHNGAVKHSNTPLQHEMSRKIDLWQG